MTDRIGNEKPKGVAWRDGVPISREFDDPYYALGNGLAESEHVFLAGNDLATRWAGAAEAHVAELGFGTGLNFLAAWRLWRMLAVPGGRLTFTSFERYPLATTEMAQALLPWAGLDKDAVLSAWPIDGVIELEDCRLEVILGDARQTLPRWEGHAEAWFLDGFAPAKNPELWGAELMAQVATHTKPGGTFATYTAAGHVRRGLEAAGFEVERVKGYGHKRHMSRGRLRV
ncbi:MAG: tRNA (5-methylaminomethyl-2-thiouridine)(34)-methyltransferase MnmD [Pseudomonadota bacterium]